MNRIPSTFIAALALLFIGPAHGASPQELEVMAITQAACDGIRLRDVAALERLLAPEFNLVSSRAEVQDRAQTIREARDPDTTYERFENHGMSARIYGSAAVVQGITSLKGTSGGTPFAVDVRFTDTLVKKGGRWVLVVSHVTRIPGK